MHLRSGVPVEACGKHASQVPRPVPETEASGREMILSSNATLDTMACQTRRLYYTLTRLHTLPAVLASRQGPEEVCPGHHANDKLVVVHNRDAVHLMLQWGDSRYVDAQFRAKYATPSLAAPSDDSH